MHNQTLVLTFTSLRCIHAAQRGQISDHAS